MDIPVVWPDYFEDCQPCLERLRETLASLAGMKSVTIHPDRQSLQLTYAKDLLTFEAIKQVARELGVTVAERFKHEKLHLIGLDCPDCAVKLETAIARLRGVAWASVNYATSMLILEYEPDRVNLAAIERRVREHGYDIAEKEAPEPLRAKTRTARSLRLLLMVFSGLLLASGLVVAFAGYGSTASVLYILCAISGGVFATRAAYYSLRSVTLDTNFLMTAAAIGAVALGEYFEAAAVMFLFSLGSTLEAMTVDKARRSIKSLVEAFPSTARVSRDGTVHEVLLDEVEVGEVVLVKPGEKIPVDGTITNGGSAVNEAPITGESLPKDKHKGDTVFAGSVNGHGALDVRTTSRVEDNTLARIVHMVEEAQAQKAPSQRFSETFGRYYTPCVITLAALVAIGGPLVLGGGYSQWLGRALTLLVVACPCALVISTPVAIVAAIANAARSGVLIKGGAHLEALGDVSVMAFDKTGTLTTGNLSLCGVVPLNSRTREEVLSIAAAVESRSEHPLADAIVEAARQADVPELHVSFFEASPGKGARAVANGGAYYVGSSRLMDEIGIGVPDSPEIAKLVAGGCTVIYVSDETELIGAIGASDTIRPAAEHALAKLRTSGIRKTVMLTGDGRRTAQAVAETLGVDEHHAELLPQQKVEKVRQLAALDSVAMVGDGINDAPALAAANVGIAMGGAGSHAAVEAADVALMADDIVMLPYAVSLSRSARRIIKQNIAIALIAVIVLVGGALGKWVTLSTGVLGHEGSALMVIANSMRLLGKRRPEV